MKFVIIGNGIAGITAARWIRKLSDHEVIIISPESEYFYSRTALMYIYMGHMRLEDTEPYERSFWAKNRLQLLNDHVDVIDFKRKILKLRSKEELSYDKLLIATGSKSNKFGWEGQDLMNVQGLYSLQDLEVMERASSDLNRAVIVGGGLIGVEMAEMFHSRNIPVTMLVREMEYYDHLFPREEAAMISRQIREHGIDLRLSSNLEKILDDGTGKVCGVIVSDTGEEIECGFVGLTPGVHPNVGFLKATDLHIEIGILTNNYLETNIPDVYAAGDCVELKQPKSGRSSIEPLWYTGRIMGKVAAFNMCGERTGYDPGIWFNSAKFFDMEYQVYGYVPAEADKNVDSFFWQSKDKEHSVRLVFDAENKFLLGVNLLGIRYRQEVCEKWINNRTPVDQVIEQIKLADFNPEFYKNYEEELISQYNRKYGKDLKSKKRRSFNHVFEFLNS